MLSNCPSVLPDALQRISAFALASAVHADGAGDFGFAAAHTGDDGSASAACIRFNDRNRLVRTRPCCDIIICIFGNKGHIDVHGLRHFNIRACDVKAESGKINKGEAAPEFPCAVDGLRTVGICGESVNITHNNRVCIAVRVAYAVFFNHLSKGFRNGGGVFKILHKVPESLFVYIIACESDALRIAVNNTCTCADNYEDAVIMNERLVKDDVYTSLHIEDYEVQCRDTKLGPEEIISHCCAVGNKGIRRLCEAVKKCHIYCDK